MAEDSNPESTTRGVSMAKSRPTQYNVARTMRPPTADAARPRPGTRRRVRRRHRIRITVFASASAAVLALSITLAIGGHSSSAGYRTSPTNWSLPTIDGRATVSLASLRGRPTVVNFFASWCQVCAAELPVFARDAVALRGRVNVIEVNALETGNGAAFARAYHLAADATAVVSDVGGAQGDGLYQSLGGSGSLPMTAFYDATGHLITTHVGGYDASTLAAQLQRLYGVAVPA